MNKGAGNFDLRLAPGYLCNGRVEKEEVADRTSHDLGRGGLAHGCSCLAASLTTGILQTESGLLLVSLQIAAV